MPRGVLPLGCFMDEQLRFAAVSCRSLRPGAIAGKWRSAQRALRCIESALDGSPGGWALADYLDPELLGAAAAVLRGWLASASAGDAGIAGFIAHSRFHEELEEALVAVSLLVRARRSRAAGGLPAAPVLDLCCGKGFTGMLVAYVAPLLPALARSVSEVVLVDWEAKGDMRKEHFEAAAGSGAALPLRYVRANLHDPHVAAHVAAGVATCGAALGVHLCKRLSSRCCEIFLALGGLDCLVLAPCCVPHAGTVSLGSSSLVVDDLWASGSPYGSWCSFLEKALAESAGGGCSVSATQPPLRTRGACTHRRNCFILASRSAPAAAPHLLPQPGVCLSWWRAGKCRFGAKKCKFEHVRGDWC